MFWKQNHGHYAHASSSSLHPGPRPFQQREACLTYDSGCITAWHPSTHSNISAILNQLHWWGLLNGSQRSPPGERVNYEVTPLSALPKWPHGGWHVSDLLLLVKPYLRFTWDRRDTSYTESRNINHKVWVDIVLKWSKQQCQIFYCIAEARSTMMCVGGCVFKRWVRKGPRVGHGPTYSPSLTRSPHPLTHSKSSR